MVVIRGRLTPEAGALLRQALAAAHEKLYQRARVTETAVVLDDVSVATPSMAQQQADALALLAESALHPIPARRVSAIRWSSTSMPTCWPTRRLPASPR